MTKTKKSRTRAAGYLRVSTARDGMKADAIYRDQIQRHGQAQGLELLSSFEDIGLSGRKGSRRRPQFEEMLTRAEAGEFDIIIVPKLSRFGRSMRDNLAAYDRLEAADVAVVFLDLGIDTSTAAGKLVRNILTAAAEFESDLISERWKDAHAFLARNGRPSGNTVYGYRYDTNTKKLTPHPAQARIVREIFERYDRGEGLRAIARELERRRVRGGRGATRWAPTLGYVLENATYIGMRSWEGELVQGTWEPIIDRELWERVQARRKATTAAHPASRRGTPKALLSGILVCGRCGGPMWHLGDRYRCATWLRSHQECRPMAVKATKAEQFVAEAFLGRLSEAHRTRALAHPGKVLERWARDVGVDDSTERQLKAIERKMAALVEASLDSPAGFDDIFRRTGTELESRREELQAEAARRTAANADRVRHAERVAELLSQVADLPAVWAKASTTQGRGMLSLAIESVQVVSGERQLKSFQIQWQPWIQGAAATN